MIVEREGGKMHLTLAFVCMLHRSVTRRFRTFLQFKVIKHLLSFVHQSCELCVKQLISLHSP